MTLVIFDCDGVLVDSEAIYIDAEIEFLNSHGLQFERDAYIREFMGVAPDEWEAKLSVSLTEILGNEPQVGFFETFHEFTLSRLKERLTAVAGAKEAIAQIETTKCVASSSKPGRLKWKLEHTELHEFFGANLFSTTMVENGKPAPDVFLHAAEVMGKNPQDCIVVEDSSNGVIAAKRAGMAAIGFVAGTHCPDQHGSTLLSDGADIVVGSYANLADAIEYLTNA